jgi:hypothetical protein
MLNIQQKEVLVKRLNPNDMGLTAQDVRLDLAEAKASLVRAQKSSGIGDKETEELRRLQLQQNLSANDPGTLRGRMAAIQQSPELLRTAEANLKGEAAFKSIAQGFFDPNSIHMKGLNEALQNVTTDTKKFDESLKTMEITPQQKLALGGEKVDTQVEINKMKNVGLAAKEQIVDIERKALKGTNVDLVTSASNQEVPLIDSFSRSMRDVGGNAEYSMRSLDARSQYLQQQGGGMADEFRLLVTAMQELVAISKANGVSKDSIDRQTAVLTETKEILNSRLTDGPNPNAIRAQAQQGANQ